MRTSIFAASLLFSKCVSSREIFAHGNISRMLGIIIKKKSFKVFVYFLLYLKMIDLEIIGLSDKKKSSACKNNDRNAGAEQGRCTSGGSRRASARDANACTQGWISFVPGQTQVSYQNRDITVPILSKDPSSKRTIKIVLDRPRLRFRIKRGNSLRGIMIN